MRHRSSIRQYARHRPEATLLYQLVERHYPELVAAREAVLERADGITEFYAAEDADETFVHDFVDAWTKVMTLDRFDFDEDARQQKAVVAR